MLQTPKAQNKIIEGKSNVQLVWICFVLNAASVETGQQFLLQDCGKFDPLELLCTCCEAFMGVL